MKKHAEGKDLYVFDGFVGADRKNRLPIRILNDHAWQSLFCRQLFVRPSAAELDTHVPEFTVLCLNDFESIPERIIMWGKILNKNQEALNSANLFKTRLNNIKIFFNNYTDGPTVFYDTGSLWTPGHDTLIGLSLIHI